ncbi:PKD domain-containing protein [Kitasatospora brasiliensis]|uniref:PKD domain-containing protein n=1 Tax=Kitasatospora brasiliensis TaxID=3058040 RepID=UPI0029306405|nr:PKD domain-containing protein [Kitasatospora sp. K002]
MRIRHAAGLSAAVVSAVVALPLPAAAAEPAAVLYVNNNAASCDNGGPGSPTVPFCTIQAAADRVLPGQTVDVVGGGYYREDVTVRRSGEPGKPIAFRGPGGITNLYTPPTGGLVTISGQHDIVFSGFNVQAFALDGVSRIGLSGNRIDQGPSEARRPAVGITGPSDGVRVERSVVYKTGGGVKAGPGATGTVIAGNDFISSYGGAQISLTDAPGTIVTHNTMNLTYNNRVNIDLAGASDHATVTDNIVGLGTVQVSPGSVEGTTYDHNIVRWPLDGTYTWAGAAYKTAEELAAATGQGKHELNTAVVFDDAFFPLSVPRTVSSLGFSPAIDSAGPDVPGVSPVDLLGHGPVAHPDTDRPGPNAVRDRGAYEVVGLQDVRLEAHGTKSPTPTGPVPFAVDLTATATNTWKTTLRYTFDFADGTAPVTSAEPTVRHTYAAPGSYRAKVTVTDSLGGSVTGELAQPVQVNEDKPLAASVAVSPDNGGDPLGVKATVTATGPYPIARYSFDFGDGTGPTVPNAIVVTERHVYAKPGTYTVKAIVTDEAGSTVTTSRPVTVDYAPAGYTAIKPTRVLDTRQVGGSYPWLGPGETINLDVRTPAPGTTGILVPPGATAVVLNLTATQGTATSHLDVYPSAAARPITSNVNFVAGQDVANLVTVPVGPDGKVVIRNNSGFVHAIADVLGYFTPGSTDRFASVAPARLLDTRSDNTPLVAGNARKLKIAGFGGVPANATSAVLNVTATDSASPGFVAVYPGGTPRPAAGSNLNTVPGRNIANQVVVPLGADGSVEIFTNAARSHLVVDVFGYYGADGKGLFTPVMPSRLLDSRDSGPFGPFTGRTVGGVPAGATAAVVNLTATGTTEPTHLTAWATGTAKPGTSSLNASPGLDVPNHTTIPVDGQGRFDIANNAGTTHVIADLFGYYRNQ